MKDIMDIRSEYNSRESAALDVGHLANRAMRMYKEEVSEMMSPTQKLVCLREIVIRIMPNEPLEVAMAMVRTVYFKDPVLNLGFWKLHHTKNELPFGLKPESPFGICYIKLFEQIMDILLPVVCSRANEAFIYYIPLALPPGALDYNYYIYANPGEERS